MRFSSSLSLLHLAFFLFFLVPVCVHSQEDAVEEKEREFGLHGAGISIGWYNPSNNYWNNTYFSEKKWANSFKGDALYTGFLELNLVKNLRLKGSVSYWTERVKSGVIKVGEVNGTEQLTTSLTFISFDVLYQFNFLTFSGINPYAGAGGNFLLVQNKFLRQPDNNDEENYTNQGQDFLGTITVGLEKVFVQHLGIGVEFRYLFGGYTQEMKDQQGDVSSHAVSLSGPQIGVRLGYIFK